MKIHKKAQMELIGLVIVVILMTLGMFLLIIFHPKPSSFREVFTNKELAKSTLSAIMKSTASPEEACAGEAITLRDQPHFGADILEDCADHYYEYQTDTSENPNGYSAYRCRGFHSCHFFKEETKDMLEKTLAGWGKKYELRSELTAGDAHSKKLFSFTSSKGGCTGVRESAQQALATEAGTVFTELKVCG